MAEPAYVSIAGEIARDIRSGALAPGTQLRSYSEMSKRYNVSEIVIRRVVDLLLRQGLVYTVERRGTFVADRPNLVRVSPERQMEDPEVTFGNESSDEVAIERDSEQVAATAEVAKALKVPVGDEVTYVATRATEGGRPISISDTYQLPGVDVATADVLEETIADRPPTAAHAEWLGTASGELVKSVQQRFLTRGGRVLMISDVSYPRDRYDAFVFRMNLNPQS
ncbi:GntR family transcriptional regulator [Nocardia brasiliensis]|uniref:GntR family transcriptional regulator n=1 Tax=Nocardia brasiliensis TaxID=37326 RepID=UPI0024590079|nr:GntR family transcriptional regulator [Nocardia brasiliensis]